MGTNPVGRGTRNVSVNMPESLKRDLEKLAAQSGLSLSGYIKAILKDAARNRVSVSQVVRPAKRGRSKE